MNRADSSTWPPPWADLAPLLRCPSTGRALQWGDGGFVEPESGREYPVTGGIAELLAEERRADAPEDGGHFDENPFDRFHWSAPGGLTATVEPELRALVDAAPPEALIVDAGCGSGRVAAYLDAEGRRALGVDLSPSSLALVRRHVSLPLLRGDVLALPLRDGVADVVISTGVIHHTPDPLRAVAELCRVLAPGGRLYLKTYRHGSYYHFLHATLGALLRGLRRLGPLGRFFVDDVVFSAYVLASRLVKPRRTRERDRLRAIYVGYFLPSPVRFARRRDVERALERAGLVIEHHEDYRYMSFHVARRPGA